MRTGSTQPTGSCVHPGKILVIRGGAIGDFILTLPALAALRRHFPHASLDILGYPGTAILAVREGLAGSVLPIESPGLASFFTRSPMLDSVWVERFRAYDLIISYIYDP